MKKVLAAIMVLTAYAGISTAGVFEQAAVMAGDKAGAISLPAVSMPEKLAGDRLADLPGATAFDKLKALFEEGVPAVKKDLTGWYAGRSVFNSGKDTFGAALLVGWDKTVNPDGGPLFEGDKVFNICLLNEKTPGYYDNMDAVVSSGIKKDLDYPGMSWKMEFPGANADMSYPESYTNKVEERKARGYVVERFQKLDGAVTILEAYSYYYKNVTPKK